jgi:DNA repair protein RadA/Sms
MMSERAAEAVRLGYRRLLVPVGTRPRLTGRVAATRLVEVSSLVEALIALQSPREPVAQSKRHQVTLRPVPNEPS